MKLTLRKLKALGACGDGVECFKQLKTDTVEDTIKQFLLTNNPNKSNYSSWLLSKVLSKDNKIKYAVFAAELVIGIFENKYPNDERPRNAIEAAKSYLYNQTEENRNAAAAAADAAYAAAYAAADAAYAAAAAAYAAADAAYAAAAAAYAAYAAAADAAYANKKEETYKQIINYGLQLLFQQDEQ